MNRFPTTIGPLTPLAGDDFRWPIFQQVRAVVLSLIAVVVLFVISISSTAAGLSIRAPLPGEVRAQQLVELLGRNDFVTRQQATSELRKIGITALGPLSEARQSPDLEVRHRATELMKEISVASHAELIAQLLDDPDRRGNSFLPGLGEYRQIVLPQKNDYLLFAEMQRVSPELFRAASLNPDDHLKVYRQHVDELDVRVRNSLEPETLGFYICALLQAASSSSLEVDANDVIVLYNLIRNQAFIELLNDPQKGAAVRRLLEAWTARPGTPHPYHRLLIAADFQLPDVTGPAVETIENSEISAEVAAALLALGKSGEREHLPRLAGLLNESACLREDRGECKLQLRDVALLGALMLLEQQPTRFHFNHLKPDARFGYAVQSAYFKSDADRQLAFQRWKEFVDAHPQFALPDTNKPAPID